MVDDTLSHMKNVWVLNRVHPILKLLCFPLPKIDCDCRPMMINDDDENSNVDNETWFDCDEVRMV